VSCVSIIGRMLRAAALVELFACWVMWVLAFVKPRRQAASQKEVARAPASKWGIGLVTLGFALIWVYVRPVGFEKSEASLIVSMVLGPPSVALAWAAARHLGKQWRYQAAVSEGHELIQQGLTGGCGTRSMRRCWGCCWRRVSAGHGGPCLSPGLLCFSSGRRFACGQKTACSVSTSGSLLRLTGREYAPISRSCADGPVVDCCS